ncbi:hypothetical protein DNTS_029585 [Danionella cerebrum]|uniref:EF-hand domain-containing family member C2 n=1 Tax=Danionella cerebrum TaxID=2873325 RepID=A0A553QVM6_9TELE|nr:hypothetical protein DNTS_029585 [Danionella translucida]
MIMSLPMLPGNSVNRNLGKEHFHKPHHFDYSNQVAMMGAEKPGIGRELLLGQSARSKYSVFPKGEGSDAPSWLAFDKQVLCFDAYFQEEVPQRREEKYRVRKCKIYFYLEDDTIQVVEPEFKNSGMPQGTLIRRHRIPLPAPEDNYFYNVHHFNINKEIILYSRSFMITDCDPFTHSFLLKMGVRLNIPASTPADPYTNLRQELEENMKPLRPYEKLDTLKQFLNHDRKVLRFYCCWDDTESTFGDCREMILHYFLADDTMEMYEVVPPNSGRDAVPKFLHRGRVPKHAPLPKHQPGEITPRTVLNVFGPVGKGGRYILDSLKTGAVEEEFYKDCDLTVGGIINIWGRRVLICDCDNFTKEFYRSKYGIEDFTPVSYKPPPPAKTARQVPPYTGFGSEEDSLCSCQGLLPKPPHKDVKKLIENDSQGLVSNVLRFVGKLLTDNQIDKERVFTICFYLNDDTIAVFEPPQRNSGVIGGRFLERGKVKKPGQELFKSEMSEYFSAQDLYVGAHLDLNSWPFQVLDADEFTLSFMEQHADEFPKANIGIIISKIKSISEEQQKETKQFFTITDPSNAGFIPFDSFRAHLSDLDVDLAEHEILTLGRSYLVRREAEEDTGLIVAVVQDHLKKKHFENFAELARTFMHEDRDRSGQLSSKSTWTICKAFRLPISDDLLRALLQKFESEPENINYDALLSALNWRENPLPAVLPDLTIKFDSGWRRDADEPAVKTINYLLFLEDVFGSATNTADS